MNRAARKIPLAGSLGYLLLNLPAGIAGFVFVVTTLAVGVSTAIIWVGVAVLALTVVGVRAAATAERARIRALLDITIPQPYRPLPGTGARARWRARVRDAATWRDLAYLVLLFPLGIAEFVVVVTSWAVALAHLALPVFYRWLPDGAYFFPSYDLRWIVVDSVPTALPWAALGMLLACVAVAVTRGLATVHARFALALLGPSGRRVREAEASFADTRVPSTVAG
ncbi:sensor domain-containing protein [Prauserella oleivorans]|uniref:Sensor domain-containing protein n=1 Tax=Prauserella oleivorans TaxID=1478153 RepID=A0ABW5WAH5_9PSEU